VSSLLLMNIHNIWHPGHTHNSVAMTQWLQSIGLTKMSGS